MSIANTLYGAAPDHSGGFIVWRSDSWVNLLRTSVVGRNDAIRYDSPSIYGFIASATWGDNDYYDVALRFAKEWNSIKIAAAIGYSSIDPQTPLVLGGDDLDASLGQPSEFLSGSISVMHVPTGLFINFAAGQKELKDEDDAEGSFWFTQGGIERNWFGYGKTTTLWRVRPV